MRTEPADLTTAVWLRLTYRDGTIARLFFQRRDVALGELYALPLRAVAGVGAWADVARAKLEPAYSGGQN